MNCTKARYKATTCAGMHLRSLLDGTFQVVSNGTEIRDASDYGSGHSGLDYMTVLETISELMHQFVQLATCEQPSIYYHSGSNLPSVFH